jgi:hypothetical protein
MNDLFFAIVGNVFNPVMFVVFSVILFAPGVLRAVDYLRRQKPDPEFQKWLDSVSS